MGNTDTKLNFRKAVIQLTTKTEPVEVTDDSFWDQFWSESVSSVQDVFTLVPGTEIRALREESPSNLATLCYKAVEKLIQAADASCRTQKDQIQVLNSVRLLTRLIPYMFEDPEWRSFFWSSPTNSKSKDFGLESDEANTSTAAGGEASSPNSTSNPQVPLAHSMLNAICDLLFCPEFTVAPNKNAARDEVDDLSSLDSCEYIWASGVGFAHTPANSQMYDLRRKELLRLLETCFSHIMYLRSPSNPQSKSPTQGGSASDREQLIANQWVQYFTSCDNRHALPLFTSLLNIVCGYDPSGILPYNHLMFNDYREELVEVALQVLVITLDQDLPDATHPSGSNDDLTPDNLFLNYLSRIHREEDFNFILKGVTRLLMNPLVHTYLPHSQRKVQFHQELLIFFWKFCEHNRKFLFFVLKSSDVLDILTPILHHLNDARADQSRVGLMHIGVFILLLLSGERNFGVRLNKPYTATIPMDIPIFTGTHADLLIIVFHKIITTGHQRLQPLFDCLLTILCNISPYIKSMSMIASCKLLHLLEAFSTPWFLFSSPSNHHLVFFLLEMFNNIIQYQFDGNSNLVYTIIRKRQVLHTLANLPTDCGSINKTLTKRGGNKRYGSSSTYNNYPSGMSTESSNASGMTKTSMVNPKTNTGGGATEGAAGGEGYQVGTFKASLMDMPTIENLTEKETAHPSQQQLDKLTGSGPTAALFSTGLPPSELSENSVVDGSLPTASQKHEYMSIQPNNIDSKVGNQSPVPIIKKEDFEAKEAKDDNLVAQNAKNENLTPKIGTPTNEKAKEASVSPSKKENLTESESQSESWVPTQDWVKSWKSKLPLQTIMRLLQVLVPQVEKICIDKGLTDESEILRFLQHGTLVGLLPVPHPILIRKYQPNPGTAMWFRTYLWGVIYLRNTDPPIWYDTDVKLFEIQRV